MFWFLNNYGYGEHLEKIFLNEFEPLKAQTFIVAKVGLFLKFTY
jgi:hypothetical protein